MDESIKPALARGQLIKAARQGTNWSQTELGLRWAMQMNRARPFSQAVISDIERGQEYVNAFLQGEALHALAHVLGLPEGQLAEVPSAVRKPRKSHVRTSARLMRAYKATFGTNDMLGIDGTGVGMQLDFMSQSGNRELLLLTRQPNSLMDAIRRSQDSTGLYEYTGENFSGRVCSWADESREFPFSLVAVFEKATTPMYTGFLIHLRPEELFELSVRLFGLPAHTLPTD